MSTKTILNDVLFKAERPDVERGYSPWRFASPVLIASEFMPVSLLSPIAHDLASQGPAAKR